MKVDVSMLDCQVAILENAIARYFATGEIPGPLGSRHPSIAPFAAFATKDGHIVIAVASEPLFAKLATALGSTRLAEDPRFATNPLRMQHWPALHEEIEVMLSAHPSRHWLALLEAAGVPCAPLNNVAEVVANPQIAARNMIVTAEDPEIGPLKMQGNPIKLSTYDDSSVRAAAPDLDAGRAVILEWLGLSG